MAQTAAQLGIRALRKVGILVAITASTEVMQTFDITDVATAALRKLAVIIPEELPSADDLAEALARARSVHALLVSTGATSWTDSTIPASVVEFYIVMVANLVAPQFGKPANQQAFDGAMAEVRQVALSGTYGQDLATQKVLAVHYSLDARGRTRWTLYDIPDYAEEPYVLKAATLLAPECGVKVDPTWDQNAEMELMRIVSLPSERRPVQTEYF